MASCGHADLDERRQRLTAQRRVEPVLAERVAQPLRPALGLFPARNLLGGRVTRAGGEAELCDDDEDQSASHDGTVAGKPLPRQGEPR